MNHIQYIHQESRLAVKSIKATLELMSEGATIPFIARYRKERIGNLNEEEIDAIKVLNDQFSDIEKRKIYVLSAIEEKGKLTDLLKAKITNCFDINLIEDYYLPYKSKRQTKADVARQSGLEGLAKLIMKQDNGDPIHLASRFVKGEVKNEADAIEGAKYIMADWMNENATVREKLRQSFLEHGVITTKVSRKKAVNEDELKEKQQKYKDVLAYSQRIQNCPSYRLLSILRAENEGIIHVKIEPNQEYVLQWMERFFVKSDNESADIVKSAILDAYKRLLQPALDTETKNYYKDKADEASIKTFSKNLEKLLLTAPLGAHSILAIDPGFRTGCKVVCLDKSGKLLNNDTVYPHPPKNEQKQATKKILQLVESYHIEAIAIGDGTAGRETENWIKHIRFNRDLKVFVVREDGASIYSASKVAREEFPQYDVTVRGSVSIGRRLADPLAELVKIDPKSLGVGQYQHDVNQAKLKHALDFVVEQCVNRVGVNVNTASKYLLAYVSGLGPKLAENVVNYREENGLFSTREALLKVPKMGAKSFEQAAGFLRVPQSTNPLDHSAVHPEQYGVVKAMANQLKVEVKDLIGNESLINQIQWQKLVTDDMGELTLKDILKELKKPGLDPRKQAKMFEFTPGIKTMDDLIVGMKVNGIVTNVTDFGAFVNIGIKENGLIHKTQLSKEYVQHPTEVVQLDDTLTATVLEVDKERKRIGLSLIQ